MANLSTQTDLTINVLSQEKYDQLKLSGLLEPHQLYFTDNVLLDAEGNRIRNIGSPSLSSDAANKQYVDNAVSSVHVPTDLSAFTNSPGYLLSNDVQISYSDRTIWLQSKSYTTSVDCNSFIKDGMLSSAELCDTVLVLKFNTDAGSDPISIELSNFVDDYDEKITDISGKIDEISGIAVETSSSLSAYELTADMFSDVSSIVLSTDGSGSPHWVCVPSEYDGHQISVMEVNEGGEIYLYPMYDGQEAGGASFPVGDRTQPITWIDYDWEYGIPFTATWTTSSGGKNILGLATLADISSIPTVALSAGVLSSTETSWVTNPSTIYGQGIYMVIENGQITPYSYAMGTDCGAPKQYSESIDEYIWDPDDWTNPDGTGLTATRVNGRNILGLAMESELSNKVDISELSDYYLKSETSSAAEISAALSSKANVQALSGYLPLSGGVMTGDLLIPDDTISADIVDVSQILINGIPFDPAEYPTMQQVCDEISIQISSKADISALSDYYLKTETSGAIEISSALSAKADLSSLSVYAEKEQVIPSFFRSVQLVKPALDGHKLHFRADIALDDQFEDLVISAFDTAVRNRNQYIKSFVVDGLSGKWEQMPSAGLFTDANDTPTMFSLADALSSIGEPMELSSQFYIRYIWYYIEDGIEVRSDQQAIAVPCNTVVGALPGDVVHKDEFDSVKQRICPSKKIVTLDATYGEFYGIGAQSINELSGEMSGEFKVILEDYAYGNEYKFQFKTGELSASPTFYIDNGYGPELATGLSVNSDQYEFPPSQMYSVMLQGDVLKVHEFGYTGTAKGGVPSRYALVSKTPELAGSALSVQIEDRTITTVGISGSTDISVYLPEKPDDGGARDFIVRFEISSSTAPGFTFIGLDESFQFDADDDDWAVMEPGLNIVSFTETK